MSTPNSTKPFLSINDDVTSQFVSTKSGTFDTSWTQYVKFLDASNYKELKEESAQQILQELQKLYKDVTVNVPDPTKPYIMEIVQFAKTPDVLRQQSILIPRDYLNSSNFKYFVLLMLLTLLLSEDAVGTPGVGLSAIQVGVPWQMFWAYLGKLDKWELVINPVFEPHENTMVTEKEGCLSIIGVTVPVPRLKSIKAKYINNFGIKNKLVLKGFDARVFQHEYDHLKGKLIVDYK